LAGEGDEEMSDKLIIGAADIYRQECDFPEEVEALEKMKSAQQAALAELWWKGVSESQPEPFSPAEVKR
jgi:hypothetical protein